MGRLAEWALSFRPIRTLSLNQEGLRCLHDSEKLTGWALPYMFTQEHPRLSVDFLKLASKPPAPHSSQFLEVIQFVANKSESCLPKPEEVLEFMFKHHEYNELKSGHELAFFHVFDEILIWKKPFTIDQCYKLYQAGNPRKKIQRFDNPEPQKDTDLSMGEISFS